MLLPRLLTALVGLPLLVWLIKLGGLPFLALTLAVTILALREYGLILEVARRPVHRGFLTFAGGLTAAAIMVGKPGLGVQAGGLGGAALSLSLVGLVLLEMFSKERSLDRLAFSVLGLLFVGWTLPHLYLLRDLRPHGEGLAWLLFLCVWTMDTAAYFTGRAIGRHPLSELSPKKTWEGAVAASLMSMLTAALVCRFLLPGFLSPAQAAGLGLLLSFFAQASDLAESMLKRASGVKESGYLLPGHGGVLDRFDSYLLAAPVLYYAALFAGQL